MSSPDPLTGPGFDALWTGQIEPQLRMLEGARRKAARQAMLIFLAFGGLVGIEALLAGWITDGKSYMPGSFILFFTFMAAVLTAVIPLNGVERRTKAKVIEALCAPLGVGYRAALKEPDVCQRLTGLGLLPRGGTRHFEDQFQGRRGDTDFMLCEARLQLGAAGNAAGRFVGQIFRITSPRRFAGVTVLLRQDGWKDRFECPSGLRPVGLEDPRFEQTWAVFGDDQIEARALLTPPFMQQLAALESAFSGAHIRCAFLEGDLMIAFEGESRFEAGGMLTNLDKRARAVGIANDIRAVFNLIDAFVAATAPSQA